MVVKTNMKNAFKCMIFLQTFEKDVKTVCERAIMEVQ